MSSAAGEPRDGSQSSDDLEGTAPSLRRGCGARTTRARANTRTRNTPPRRARARAVGTRPGDARGRGERIVHSAFLILFRSVQATLTFSAFSHLEFSIRSLMTLAVS